ncbi:hypothetical protein [uncultured Sneathia sp.]|jgi:hypothetical protein|uniref:type III toxin-antitoxin system CptIN family toxin n=2 Tax=uncultured Sneathia sp. TaxID=278067 RepID=UPI0025978D83|nr:hypothetical protein [uncultured Sneathia sp.]
MKVKQGYSYHIKDCFFSVVSDPFLMSNKENENYRPHYYAIEDSNNKDIFWMIPISSKVEKYKKIISSKIKKIGKCSTIVIGIFAGKENAFLIQNAFPVKVSYFDHLHTVQGKPVTIHKKLDKELKIKLKEVISMKKKGINLFLTDVDMIFEVINKLE